MPSSISILNEPPAYSPVYNRVEFCVNETDAPSKAQTNYKYIFTVSIDNGLETDSQKFYVPFFPDVSATNFGILDISRYLDAYVKERIVNPGLAVAENGFYQGEDTFVVEYSVNIQSGC